MRPTQREQTIDDKLIQTAIPAAQKFWKLCVLPELLGKWYTYKQYASVQSTSLDTQTEEEDSGNCVHEEWSWLSASAGDVAQCCGYWAQVLTRPSQYYVYPSARLIRLLLFQMDSKDTGVCLVVDCHIAPGQMTPQFKLEGDSSSSSPSRMQPKKATQHIAQMTTLS